VPPGFWDEIAAKLTIRFKNGEFTDGIVETINAAGEHLKQYFSARHRRRERAARPDRHQQRVMPWSVVIASDRTWATGA